jgi:hypothetical protein
MGIEYPIGPLREMLKQRDDAFDSQIHGLQSKIGKPARVLITYYCTSFVSCSIHSSLCVEDFRC